MNEKKTLVVVGGGAAGFFCAINAAMQNNFLKVIILEKTNKLLSKVKVSGGGRCNVTHACFEMDEMIKRYPRGKNFVKRTFHQFFTNDTIKWFEERDVKLKTEADGRMFPVSNSSQSVINCLMQEANNYAVEILLNAEVKQIDLSNGKFEINLNDSRKIKSEFLCIASGGYPKISQFDWITKLGHSIKEPVPSLFTFNIPHHPISKLMGISVADVEVRIASTKLRERGALLITHWGLSGPVILRLSAWGARDLHALNYDFSVSINWLPSFNEENLRQFLYEFRNTNGAQKVSTLQPFAFPQRLWEFFLAESGIDLQRRWSEVAARKQNKLIKTLCAHEMSVKGKTTFKDEFVTAGGVELGEVDANTMQSKKVNGLYFAGEILNVDGITGGFNFQHAWTSGWIAAKSIAAISNGE
jgi:predicted Rossmann fold flavoprotein